jgi:hypothetical protein
MRIRRSGLESNKWCDWVAQEQPVYATIFRHCNPAGHDRLGTNWFLVRAMRFFIRRFTLSAPLLRYTAPDHESSLQMAPSAYVGSTRGPRIYGEPMIRDTSFARRTSSSAVVLPADGIHQ